MKIDIWCVGGGWMDWDLNRLKIYGFSYDYG
jgi:hypothetical protein